jgi:hypothetical protein
LLYLLFCLPLCCICNWPSGCWCSTLIIIKNWTETYLHKLTAIMSTKSEIFNACEVGLLPDMMWKITLQVMAMKYSNENYCLNQGSDIRETRNTHRSLFRITCHSGCLWFSRWAVSYLHLGLCPLGYSSLSPSPLATYNMISRCFVPAPFFCSNDTRQHLRNNKV